MAINPRVNLEAGYAAIQAKGLRTRQVIRFGPRVRLGERFEVFTGIQWLGGGHERRLIGQLQIGSRF